jgi:hypothetical protein
MRKRCGDRNLLSSAAAALKVSSFALMAALASPSAHAQAQPKPNVVFILADNVGYGDLGPYGGGELRSAPTPRIDQLAHEGLNLTQFLIEPACTPSRAALLTSRYSIREGLSLVIIAGSENGIVDLTRITALYSSSENWEYRRINDL